MLQFIHANAITQGSQQGFIMFYVQRKSPNTMMTIKGWMTIAAYATKQEAEQAWANLMNNDMRIISRKQWHIQGLG